MTCAVDDHELGDGAVCASCHAAVLEDLRLVVELMRVVTDPAAGLDHVLRGNVHTAMRRLSYVPR